MAVPRKAVPEAEATLLDLRTSHYRLSVVLESLVEAVAQYDREGRLQAANASARKLVPGTDLADLVARAVQEDGSPWPTDAHPATLALRSGQPCTGLVMGIGLPEGKLAWVSLNVTPLLYRSRRPWGIVVSLTDITERRQVQRRNEVVADLLQIAQQVEGEAELTAAIADRLALWARCAQVTFRFPDGPARGGRGHRASEAIQGAAPGPLWSDHASLEPASGTLKALSLEGWESVAIQPLHLGGLPGASLLLLDPRPGGFDQITPMGLAEMAGLVGNILAKALAEKALRERADALARSRGQLAQAQALAGLGSWFLDLPAQRQEWSPETYLHWACDPSQPVPSLDQLLQKVHPEDREAFSAFLARLRTTRFTEEQDLRVVAPDGGLRHLLLQAIPLTGLQEPQGRFQVACMDITTRKQSELALRDLARLSAKGQMAAYIAHEINNPLAGIRNAFLLLEGAVPATHPHRAYIPLITREIDRIASIIRTMYHLYRPEPGDSRKVVMPEVFFDLESLLAPKCRGQGATIAFDHSGMREVGALNEGFFRQVLFNLIQNALEASSPGGEVTVRARSDEGWLEVAVGDHGPGIPPDQAELIFQSGFTTKLDTQMSGLGLGLATCRSLVESMGGTLAFRDQTPPPGTLFTVRLPFAPP